MSKLINSLCVLISASVIAYTPLAYSAEKTKETPSSSAKKTTKKATTSAQKKPSKTTASKKKTTKTSSAKTNKTNKSKVTYTSRKSNVSKLAIANARQDVQVTRTIAARMDADNPGVQSSGVLVLNQQSGEVLYEKNADSIIPIASITKLMTAMVVLDARLPLNELISITEADIDTLKNTSSRLSVGTTLTRGEMLLLALMSSENRAASTLSHHFPGGKDAFIRKMNEKAQQLGMRNSRFYDSTGLNPSNVSSARELGLMVKAAQRYPEIHQFSTSSEYTFASNKNGSMMTFRNTNPLVKDSDWDIGVSKTGFINEAGRCIVMQAMINGKPVVIVLMDSNGKYTRIGDAQRIRKWIETSPLAKLRAG
ncbi:D-alanyl-D-alanine endopeptidase [Deefgea piscis]|uniref:D-alanyl-D-alanine endopeptidase n=1 Tax=Deefgea piscis TaxID=2739061 RepID=UPI001C7F5701|nr:D-alanyl-D-alanine endopeptidase [Deefgea piscis]QZA80009.1 D-alanyl-D-alanine endopeptidase [Deefgea piscis]